MYSRKRFSYQLRLFIPIALILWLFAAALGVFHYERGMNQRELALKSDVDHIASFLVKSYDSSATEGTKSIRDKYLAFLDSFYVQSSLDDISVTIYDNQNKRVENHSGNIDKMPLPDGYENDYAGRIPTGKVNILKQDGSVEEFDIKRNFYYSARRTQDQRYTVMVMMPFITGANTFYSMTYLWMLFGATVLITFFIYLYTSHISKNVIAMKRFVEKEYKGESDSSPEFANDELGDIGRKIVELYESRQRAFEEIENEHEIALKATEEKNNLRLELTNNINHELKTPIGILKGYIDTIIDTPDMDEEIRSHFLRNCTVQIGRLTDMVTDLSMIARLEGGASNIPTEKLDMNYIVNSCKSDFSNSNLLGDMDFKINIPEETYIKGNFNLLNNMIANLAKNAVAYSGGTEIGVKMLAKNKRFYSFSFYDNGKGIPEEYVPRLFERFFRVDSGRSRKKGGTGLGLPIVKTTLQTLGGTISARNRKEGGLEFIFTIPIWNDSENKTTDKN